MTQPKAYQLEPSTGLSPLARDWIKALVSETSADLHSCIGDATKTAAPPPSSTNDSRVDDLIRRIEYLERRAESDDRYVLTKGKIIELMKKHGIE
jgi:hypothetical protein